MKYYPFILIIIFYFYKLSRYVNNFNWYYTKLFNCIVIRELYNRVFINKQFLRFKIKDSLIIIFNYKLLFIFSFFQFFIWVRFVLLTTTIIIRIYSSFSFLPSLFRSDLFFLFILSFRSSMYKRLICIILYLLLKLLD